jgi:hypothetical protein
MGEKEIVRQKYVRWVDGADIQSFLSRQRRLFWLGSSFGCYCGLLNGASGMRLAEKTNVKNHIYDPSRRPMLHLSTEYNIMSRSSLRRLPGRTTDLARLFRPFFELLRWRQGRKDQVRVRCVKTITMHVYIWLYVPYPP